MALDTDYIAFYVKDFTGANSLSGYALDICPFTFIPRLYLDRYSDERILWDFGDGTTSTSLCATHAYLFPGKYNVQLYVYGDRGQAYTSTYTATVDVKNFITDTICLTSKSNYIQEAGSLGHPEGITVIRYNSWQSYNALSGKNYTIKLFASGSNDNFFNIEEYNSQKYSHLDLSYKFFIKQYNNRYKAYSYIPVDSVQTDNNTLLYAKISGGNLVLCSSQDEGSTFVGSKGTANVYFCSDQYNIDDLWYRNRKPVMAFAGFDTSNFDDIISYENGYKEIVKSNKFSYLNNITTNIGFSIIPQLSSNQLVFSLNGIDGLGDEKNSFSINSLQYAGTKIPLVIRVKDVNNYPTKYIPLLSAVNTTPTQDFQFKIIALSGTGGVVSPSGQPVIVSDPIYNHTIGGYWKGYLYFNENFVNNNSLENIYLSAYTTFNDTYNFVKHPTPLAIILNSLSSQIVRVNLIQDLKGSDLSLDLSIDSVQTFNSAVSSASGMRCVQVIPEENESAGSYYSLWVSDSQSNRIIKYNTFGLVLSSIDTSTLTLSSGGPLSIATPSPYHIAADGDKNVWVSLYNSVSTLKINNITGRVDYVAVPNLINNTYTFPVAYLGYVNLSSFIGKNTILPGAIDTDTNNNVWVTYTNPLSSYIFKYSSTGTILSSIYLTAGYSPVDIAVGTDNNVWIIAQEYYTTNTDISAFNDIIVYHNNSTGNTTSVYETTGRAANITIDTNNNAYFTVGNNTVVKLLSSNFTPTVISTEASLKTPTRDKMDLKGIASTASKEIISINNSNNKLNIIDTVANSNINNYYINNDQNDIAATGDWTGFKWIAKFSPRFFTINKTLTGASTTFSVNKAEDKYQIGKFGENFDATQLYKDLRYQEALLTYNNMFDGFIGTIVGNISSSPNTLGKRVYEKAENFVDNTVDPDTCDVDALFSMCKMYGITIDQFERYKFTTPANLRRVIDLLSIKQSKLWGTRNKFSKDFDINGYNPGFNDFYGKNLGPEINIQYTILTAGSASTPIVAQSKFSNDYIYINTDILSSQHIEYINGTETYNMSGFNKYWGWPLVLPENPTYEDLKQSYRFFQYRPGFENTQYEGIINWGDVVTHLSEGLSSREDWIGEGRVMEEIIRFTLLDGLSVFNSSIPTT